MAKRAESSLTEQYKSLQLAGLLQLLESGSVFRGLGPTAKKARNLGIIQVETPVSNACERRSLSATERILLTHQRAAIRREGERYSFVRLQLDIIAAILNNFECITGKRKACIRIAWDAGAVIAGVTRARSRHKLIETGIIKAVSKCG